MGDHGGVRGCFIAIYCSLREVSSLKRQYTIGRYNGMFSIYPTLHYSCDGLSFQRKGNLFREGTNMRFYFMTTFFVLFFLYILGSTIFQGRVFVIL